MNTTNWLSFTKYRNESHLFDALNCRVVRHRYPASICPRCLMNWQILWWRHQMETFSALMHSQRPVTHSFDVFFDLRLNKRLSKQLWGWRFETASHSLWRHCNDKSPDMGTLLFILFRHVSYNYLNNYLSTMPTCQQFILLTQLAS